MVSCMLMVLLWSFTAVALFIPSGVFNTAQFVYGTFTAVEASGRPADQQLAGGGYDGVA